MPIRYHVLARIINLSFNFNYMRNIFLIPTDKPSRLVKTKPKGNWLLFIKNIFGFHWDNYNIYITSDEEITQQTKPCWCINTIKNTWNDSLIYYQGTMPQYHYVGFKKIILTTDQDLIKDGIQAIDDEFLGWFVKNPSCESVEVQHKPQGFTDGLWLLDYKAIIPKQEEPKQETLEEFIAKTDTPDGLDQFSYDEGIKFGVNSNAAREYWFEQWKALGQASARKVESDTVKAVLDNRYELLKMQKKVRFTIACRIDDFIKEKFKTQAAFSAKINRKQPELSMWISGANNFRIDTLTEVCYHLGVDVVDVLTQPKDAQKSFNVAKAEPVDFFSFAAFCAENSAKPGFESRDLVQEWINLKTNVPPVYEEHEVYALLCKCIVALGKEFRATLTAHNSDIVDTRPVGLMHVDLRHTPVHIDSVSFNQWFDRNKKGTQPSVSFNEADMLSFANFVNLYPAMSEDDKTIKELFHIWSKQKFA